MTRNQQTATKKLESAQVEFLLAYGWEPQGKFWIHRKLKNKLDGNNPVRHTMLDAMAQTRADLTLGWP